MDNDTTDNRVPLAKAVLQWCDPDLIEAVKAAERRYIPHELNEFYGVTDEFRFRILPDVVVRSPGGEMGWGGRASLAWITAAWTALEADFRRQLSTRVYLRGVQISPNSEAEPTGIPQAWASDAKFNIGRGVIEVAGRRYAAVTASTIPPPPAKATGIIAPAQAALAITEASISLLSDDEILLLLEEHAKRIINSPDAKLIEPGKISLMPIVRRKLIHRATKGEILPTLAAEALFLARWIAEKVDHYATPSEGTISKVLGKEYAIEKARSKAAI